MPSPNSSSKASKYKIPTRNASILGYGDLRPDGRRKERRRPSSINIGSAATRAEAKAIANGTGVGLTDRQLMILCFLPHMERHNRASSVFNKRGEFYSLYKRMTTKSDDFLEECGMPRISVPRMANDRPDRRNVGQVRMEEADMAKRRSAAGVTGPGYTMDGKAKDGVETGAYDYQILRSVQKQARSQQTVPVVATGAFGPIVYLDAFLFPHLIQEDVTPYMWAEFREKEIKMPITINATTMSYQDVCTRLIGTFLGNQNPSISEVYVDTLVITWNQYATGKFEFVEVFEYNWKEEGALFLTQHPPHELTLGFGLELVEEWAKEEIPIDPTLFS